MLNLLRQKRYNRILSAQNFIAKSSTPKTQVVEDHPEKSLLVKEPTSQ